MTFTGSIVAIVTPFAKGAVDFDKLDELVEMHVKAGTDGIVPCGTTGESPTLTHSEHDAVIARTVKAARGRLAVIAGTGSNSTDEAIQLSQHAEKAGADGLLQVSPYYNKPTQEGLYRHFKAVAESVRIPVVLYNIPSRCVVGLTLDTYLRLAEVKNIVGTKEAAGSTDLVSEIVQRTKLTVLSGDDSMTLPFMSVGAKGVISVVANIAPKDVKALFVAFAGGGAARALALHNKLYPLTRAMFLETNPSPVKSAMKMLGMCSDEVRLPMVAPAKDTEAKIRKALQNYGLL
jgi:4-hydroxy-tetrahydrodipicolinate synthase